MDRETRKRRAEEKVMVEMARRKTMRVSAHCRRKHKVLRHIAASLVVVPNQLQPASDWVFDLCRRSYTVHVDFQAGTYHDLFSRQTGINPLNLRILRITRMVRRIPGRFSKQSGTKMDEGRAQCQAGVRVSNGKPLQLRKLFRSRESHITTDIAN